MPQDNFTKILMAAIEEGLSSLGESPKDAIFYHLESSFQLKIMITHAIACAAAFALIMIGVFSEDAGSLHGLWSDIFFMLNLIVLILIGASLFTHPRCIKAIPAYGFIVAIINLAYVFTSNTPLLEWFTVFTALAYVGLFAYNTTKV